MPETPNLSVCVEPATKERAEQIFELMGISMSQAVGMFLQQAATQDGIPRLARLPVRPPVAYGSLTMEEFDAELEKGAEDFRAGRFYTIEEVEDHFRRDYGIDL